MKFEPGRCPICGGASECQYASTDGYKGLCWCAKEDFPQELLRRVPEDARNVACICRRCVISARFAAAMKRPAPSPGAGDYYVEGSFIVFTEAYHRRRGYCCASGCRHCPFDSLEREVGEALRANA
jgi:hypothetical protein